MSLPRFLLFSLCILSACGMLLVPVPVASSPHSRESGGASKKTEVKTDSLGDPLPSGALLRLGTARFRHPSIINAMDVSPDGSMVVSSSGGRLCLWETKSGKLLHEFRHTESSIYAVRFSPDGKLLASAEWHARAPASVRVWDLNTKKVLHVLPMPMLPHATLSFSPDSTMLAGGSSKEVSLWNVKTGKLLSRFEAHPRHLSCVRFSPTGKYLACGGPRVSYKANEDLSVRVIEVATKKVVWKAQGTPEVQDLAFSPDEKTLAVAGLRGPVRLLEVSTGKVKATLEKGAFSVAFSPDGKLLAADTCSALTLQVWSVASQKKIQELRGHGGLIRSLAFLPDNQTLVSASHDGSVRQWSIKKGVELHRHPGHQHYVYSLQFLNHGEALVSYGGDHTVRLWNLAKGKLAHCWKIPTNNIDFTGGSGYVHPYTLSVSPDNRFIAAHGVTLFDRTVHLWSTRTNDHVATLRDHEWGLNCVCYSPNGKLLATADRSGTVHLRSAKTRKVLRSLTPPQGAGTLTFSPDSQQIAIGGGGRSNVYLWDAKTGARQGVLETDFDDIRSLAYGHDGKMLAMTGHASGRAYLIVWDLPNKTKRKIHGHEGRINVVSFSPGGGLLATGGENDEQVRVWESLTGKEVLRFKGHRGAILCLAFSPKGGVLASGSRDTTILLWDLLAPGRKELAGIETKPDREMFLEQAWRALASEDARLAYQATCSMVLLTEEAQAFLKSKLTPPDNPKTVAELIKDLDNRKFQTRQRAFAQLKARGITVEKELRKALQQGSLSLEAKTRVQQLVHRLDHPDSDSHIRRQTRAQAVLGWIKIRQKQ